MSDQTNTAWWALRIAFFIGLVLSGLDKFLHLLTNWDQYLSPMAQRMLGGHGHQFTLVAGALEIILGLLVITNWTKLGAYLASGWMLIMAINLVMTGQYRDIALRDLALCLSAFALAKLTSAGEAEMLHIVPTEMERAA